MGIWSSITGKSVEDKVTEYSEVYGEVLLGVHRELENQKNLLQSWEQRLDLQFKKLKEEVTAITSSVTDLEQRIEKIQAEVTVGFNSFRSAVEKFQSETAALAIARESVTQLSEAVNQSSLSMKADIAVHAKQVRQLWLLCILSYLFTSGLGVAVWLLR